MVINKEDLKKLHSCLLAILTEIDRICRKNNIQYSLDGGTLLGAIRHQGFIPWDDDADVIMRRQEYEKFFSCCERDLNTKDFFLQDYRTDPFYRWGYSKMRLNGTCFVSKGQEEQKFHNGIFVDIFIADNVPDLWLTRRLHLLACFVIRKCQYSTVGIKCSSFFSRMMFYILSLVPRDYLFKVLNRLAERQNRMDRQLVRHLTYPYPSKESKYGTPSSCFESFIDCSFENHRFRIFEQYDLYLSLVYGDYMKLPPPQCRVSHFPVSKLSFRKDDTEN